MSRDLYASLSGASAMWRQVEMLSHNVSNTDTEGFKEFTMIFEEAGGGEGPLGRPYATPRAEAPIMTNGALEYTNDPFHFALQGDGFFAVESQAGVSMSRAGRFTPDAEGYLIDPQGNKLLGQSGPIQIPPGETISVASTGEIYGSLSGELDRIRLVKAATPKSMGGSLWDARGGMVEATPEVLQGALEGSNVDPVRMMVELMEAYRHFEAQQKVMQSSDSMDSRLNQSGGS